MNKFILVVIAFVTFFAISCKNDKMKDLGMSKSFKNPFLEKSKLPYETVDFDNIKTEDFEPAIMEGLKLQKIEIDSIVQNKEAPTFENTIVALEKSGQVLSRTQLAFSLLVGANTNPQLQTLEEKLAPILSAQSDEITLNRQLFDRIKKVYDQKKDLNLDVESLRLVENIYQSYVMNGALLNDQDKERLKKLNSEEASLGVKFTNQILAADKNAALLVDDKSLLEGLPENEIEAAANNANDVKKNNKWMIPIINTTQQPSLLSLKKRDVRKNLFDASWNRAVQGDSNDTRKIILQLVSIRANQAKILGFNNYATWRLQNQMAKTPEAVAHFFRQLIPSAVKKVMKESEEIQKNINAGNDTFKVKAYDWDFYAEKVRKAKYDLDESIIKPYFVLDSVLLNGVFYAANKLYGITFKERKDIPIYHVDVKVFELFNEDGTQLGLYYTDFYKRDNKNGGAWMSNLVLQSKLLNTKPVIYNVCNFPKPAKGHASLISYDDVNTLFHEFGHALHGFFANQTYPSISGTSVPSDFVEFPSQFNENWALYPEVLKNYAKHYKTGEKIPNELVQKIKNSQVFNQGYALVELLAAANLDIQWHSLNSSNIPTDVDQFEKNALIKTNLSVGFVPPRYRSSYFKHIFGGNDYAAGYYAYSWTEMLGHDAFSWFVENGGLNKANGQRFREMILSKGNTEDCNLMYKKFRGQEPNIKPMLKFRGLL